MIALMPRRPVAHVTRITGAATIVPGLYYMALGAANLTVPSTIASGASGVLEQGGYGTARLTLPSNWEVQYAGLPVGWYGRPAVAEPGGVMHWEVVQPGRIRITGDYARTPSAWHPIDAGSSLFGVWQAGRGHNWSAISGTSETVPGSDASATVWEPLFCPVEDRRLVYDWTLSADADSYAATRVADATFGVGALSTGIGYIMRTGASTARIWKAIGAGGVNAFPASGAGRLYIAIRQHSTAQNGTSLVRLSTVNAPGGYGGFQGGLLWTGANGYQYAHATSSGLWGAKSGVLATHEDTVSRVLISAAINTTGGAVIYSGKTQVSAAMASTGNAVLPVNKFDIYTSQNSTIGVVAYVEGVSGDLGAEQDFFLAMA